MAERERTPYGVERLVLRDPELGVLRFRPDLGWWEGDFPGDADAALFVDGEEQPDAGFLPRARATVGAVARGLDEIKAFAASALRDLHTERWNTDDAPLPHEAFVRALALSSVALRGDGTVEVYLDDGDLFDGQGIRVTLDRDLVPCEAVIASE